MKKLLLMMSVFAAVFASAQTSHIKLELETSGNARFVEDEFEDMAFMVNRLRLDFQGDLGDNLYYHFRTTYHKKADPFAVDNISRALEMANIRWSPSEKFDLVVGKQFVEHAGYENYVNVLLVREFTDFNSNIEVYMTGLKGTYHFNPDQQLTFQLTNNRSETHNELFANSLGIEPAKIPLMGTLNWNGWFADRALNLMYATSVSQVAQGKYLYYFTGGNIYQKGPILTYFDIMYARGQVDKSQRITSLTGGLLPVAQNTEYLTLIADFEYQFAPKWNAYIKGAYETASVYEDNGFYKKGTYLNTWNAQACLEWFPMNKKKGLKIYLHYVYKGNELQDRALALKAVLPDSQRISLGLTYSFPVL